MINIDSYLNGIQNKADGEAVIDDILDAAEKLCCKSLIKPDGIADIETEKTIIKTDPRGNVIRKAIARLLSKLASYEPNKKVIILTDDEYEYVHPEDGTLYVIRRDDSCFAVELDNKLNFNVNGKHVRLPSVGDQEVWWEAMPGFLKDKSYLGNATHVELFAGKDWDITLINREFFRDIKNLTRVTIDFPSYVIHEWAFFNCSDLHKVNLGSGITEIHSTAFIGCEKLNTVVINKSQDSIPGAPWGAENATVLWTG